MEWKEYKEIIKEKIIAAGGHDVGHVVEQVEAA